MKSFLVSMLAVVATAAPLSVDVSKRTDTPYGIKKGLAYNNGPLVSHLSLPDSAVWAYNWGASPNAPAYQQIPMMWGTSGDSAGCMSMVKAGAPYVMGYNE